MALAGTTEAETRAVEDTSKGRGQRRDMSYIIQRELRVTVITGIRLVRGVSSSTM